MRDALLDLVTGARCLGCARPGRVLCPACGASLGGRVRVVRPRPCPPGLVPVRTTAEYEGLIRELILAHKERAAHGLAAPLGRTLGSAVLELAPQLGAEDLVLVPVPSHASVVRARGHDPVLRVTRRAAREARRRGLRCAVRRLLVVRERPADQAGLDAWARRTNLEGKFSSRPGPVGRLPVLLLLDDVVTTGATLREAQRALEAAGWPVGAALTLAATRLRRGLSPSRSDG